MDLTSQAASPMTVLLVEDHAIFREQLSELIKRQPDMAICGETDTAAEALEMIESKCPSIVLIDITLKGRGGLELLKDIKARDLRVPSLVLSMHDELLYAERVLKAGARGYITKHETSKEVLSAIRRVVAGEVYLGTRMSARVLESFSTGPSPQQGMGQLTDRELEVFQLIGEGRGTREICGRLHLGVSTIDTYRARIKAKLNIDSGSQLTHEAIRWVSQGQSSADGD
ncbi:MAG: response regulator [Chthoniobacterales bacterium]